MGTLVGSVIAVVWSEVRSTNQWDRLGIYFFSTLIGLLVAVVAYIVALTVVAWRLFPPGRRAVPVLLTLLAHVIVLGVTAVLMATLQPAEDAYAAASMLLTLAGLACGPAVFPACGTTGRLRFAAVATVAAIILTAGVVTVVSHVFARETAYVNGHAGS
ncbi:hypothetical protein AB0M36_18230 [Actinoplanes sp. NPDC051346]|uniref:hypothetical protein n=1 Tax=Actinoplanes sp. NPDC051346 TaxID=3155048 RepID=UPI00343ABA84